MAKPTNIDRLNELFEIDTEEISDDLFDSLSDDETVSDLELAESIDCSDVEIEDIETVSATVVEAPQPTQQPKNEIATTDKNEIKPVVHNVGETDIMGTELFNHDSNDDDSKFEDEFADIMSTVRESVETAQYILTSTPEADTVEQVAAMYNSARGMLGELNKVKMLKMKQAHQERMEMFKAMNKMQLQKLKSEADAKKAPQTAIQINTNNSTNVNNNNDNVDTTSQQGVEFCTEDLVKIFNQARKDTVKSTEDSKHDSKLDDDNVIDI